MNCCNNNNKNDHDHKQEKKTIKHMLLMVLCCGAPIIFTFALLFIGNYYPNALSLSVITPFLCPLFMVGMVAIMFKKDKTKATIDTTETKSIEDKKE
ncbi:MAG: hypothetical protein K0R55_4553 [Sporomusa sp.]|jgi:hypothetical protein|nr:hypothetical protein [Sporomusa sp.]